MFSKKYHRLANLAQNTIYDQNNYNANTTLLNKQHIIIKLVTLYAKKQQLLIGKSI